MRKCRLVPKSLWPIILTPSCHPTGEVMDIVERLPKTVQAMTGVDLVANVKSMTA